MRRTSVKDMNCSVAQCLEVVGDWWTLLIVRDLFFGVRRFSDLQRRLGVARNILTERLERLVDTGVIAPRAAGPPGYVLTARGRALWPVLEAMRHWGDEWAAPDGAPVDLVHRSCGHVTHAVPTCAACGEPLTLAELDAVAGPGANERNPLGATHGD